MSEIVTLRSNGVELRGWTSVSVSAGLTMAARAFNVGVTYPWPQAKSVISAIEIGDPVEVWIGSDPVISGYVFAVPISYSADSISVSISGRSKTADIVDCSPIAWSSDGAPSGSTVKWSTTRAVPVSGSLQKASAPLAVQWTNAKIEQIAADLCAPYGVEVSAQVDTGAPVTCHALDPGETVFESINRLLSLGQLFATDDAAGRLVLTEPGAGGNATGGLALGVNILSCSANRDGSDVFSSYVIEGQRSGSDEAYGVATSHIRAVAKDSKSRFRMYMNAQSGSVTQSLCQRLANFEMRRRRALLQQVTYTVVGWRDAGGKLWRPNTFVRVKDSLLGIDARFLLAEVEYQLTDQGFVSVLNLAPIEAFMAAPKEAVDSWVNEVRTPGT